MEHNSDFRYDLKVGETAENEFAEILSNSKVEVKYDQKALETRNLFIEYESRGKKSGIAASEADFYVFKFINNVFVIIKTEDLKELCRQYLGTQRDVRGGDSQTSKGILLPLKDLI